jgi:hypothetical protein
VLLDQVAAIGQDGVQQFSPKVRVSRKTDLISLVLAERR